MYRKYQIFDAITHTHAYTHLNFILFVSLLCVSVTYLVGGIIFNKVRNNAAGIEMIPNHEFWVGLPGLVAVCIYDVCVCCVCVSVFVGVAQY